MAYRGSRPLIAVSIAMARKSLSRSRTSMHGSNRPHSPCQPNRIGAFNPGPEMAAEPLAGPSPNGPFAIAGAATQSIAPAATARSINRLPMPRLLGTGPPGSMSRPPSVHRRPANGSALATPPGRDRSGRPARSESGLGPLGQILRTLLQGAPDLAD